MKRVPRIAIAAALACAILLAVLLGRQQLSTWWQWRHNTKPDLETRKAVSGLRPAQIDAIEIRSPSTRVPWHEIVKDRRAIGLLLTGLQGARLPDPVRENRAEQVIVRLKNGKSVGPFGFSTDRPIDAVSPTFIEGLKAIKMKLPAWGR